MDEACSAYRREEYTGFGGGNLRERNRLGDPGVDVRIILRLIFRKLDVGLLDWIELAQDRERWRALVNVLMNLRIKCGEFLD
jgi:hypothetical protein